MSEPLFWSEAMDQLFRECVHAPVYRDPDTDFSSDPTVLLGVPFPVVRDQVIQLGMADFSASFSHPVHGTLSADQRVLLYCFVNMRRHFYACRATYDQHRDVLEHLWAGQPPVVIDVGCGPATAGLALADTFPGRTWEYVGVDAAPPMLVTAERHMSAAVGLGLRRQSGPSCWLRSWREREPQSSDPAAPVLIICSYLFASGSLTATALTELAEWVRGHCRVAERPLTLLAYLNSTDRLANINYELFKSMIGLDPAAHRPERSTVRFRSTRNTRYEKSEDFLQELLVLPGGRDG